MIRSIAVILCLIPLVFMQGCAGHRADTATRHDSNEPVWIDVRTDAEYQAGHLDAAIHIPYEEIADRIQRLQLAPDQPIYLYCGSGRRAGIAMETLAGLGYTHLTNVGSLENALQWPGQPQAQSPEPSNLKDP